MSMTVIPRPRRTLREYPGKYVLVVRGQLRRLLARPLLLLRLRAPFLWLARLHTLPCPSPPPGLVNASAQVTWPGPGGPQTDERERPLCRRGLPIVPVASLVER